MATLLEQHQRVMHGEAPYSPVAKLIGVTFQEIEPGHAVVTLDTSPHHTNPHGVMAGGILSALADIAMAVAHDTLLGEHEGSVTLELKINFIKPVRDGTLRAVGRVLNKGRRISVVESDVRNADDDLVAHATGTFMIVSTESSRS